MSKLASTTLTHALLLLLRQDPKAQRMFYHGLQSYPRS